MPLYQGYELDALEDQYNIEATVEDVDIYRAEYAELTEQFSKNNAQSLDVSYGPDPLQKLDIYPAKNTGCPIIVYIHGGYWARGDKAPFGFPAKIFNQAGATWISINYRLAEEFKLEEVVGDARNALAWIYNNAEEFGGDQNRICVIGNSAGSHLTSMLAAAGWQNAYNLPEDVIKSVAVCSGLYDLEPFRQTSQKEYLNLNSEEVQKNSPIHHLPRKDLKILVTWAANETNEFTRQSEDYAKRCQAAGISVETLFHPDHNHFSWPLEFKNAESDLVQKILKLIA